MNVSFVFWFAVVWVVCFVFFVFFFLYTATVTLHNNNGRRFDSKISEKTYNHGWTIESSNSLDASHTDAFSGARL